VPRERYTEGHWITGLRTTDAKSGSSPLPPTIPHISPSSSTQRAKNYDNTFLLSRCRRRRVKLQATFDTMDDHNSNDHNLNDHNSNDQYSPTSQYLSFLIASADSASGIDYGGSMPTDFLSDFLYTHRSQTRSTGSGNSPRQSGTQNTLINPQPLSPSSSRQPLSSIAGNNVRPPPPPIQPSSGEHDTQKTQPSISRGSRISSSQWESHRAKIKELFMDNDKSLEETMKFMEKTFSFSPSYAPTSSFTISISTEY
jgi:hypothetical protein